MSLQEYRIFTKNIKMKKYIYFSISKLISFFIVFIFAKELSKTDVGLIAFYQSVTFFLIPLLSLQLPSAIFRFYGNENYMKEIKVARGFFNYICILSFVFLLLFVYVKNIYIAIFSVTLLYTAYYINLEYRRREKGDKSYFFSQLIQTLSFALLAFLFIWVGDNKSYEVIIISEYISIMLVMAFIVDYKNFNIKLYKVKHLFKYSVPLIPNSICWWFLSSGMIFLYSKLFGDKLTAILSINYKIPSFIIVLSGMIIVIWQSDFLYKHNNKELTLSFIKKRTLIFFFLFFCLSSIICFFSVFFIKTYYSTYFYSYWFSFLLSLISLLFSFNTYLGIQYIISSNTYRASKIMLVGTLLTMGLSLLLGMTYEHYGILYGYIIGLIITFCIRFYDFMLWGKLYE